MNSLTAAAMPVHFDILRFTREGGGERDRERGTETERETERDRDRERDRGSLRD